MQGVPGELLELDGIFLREAIVEGGKMKLRRREDPRPLATAVTAADCCPQNRPAASHSRNLLAVKGFVK